jgi:hypothetical protein
MYMWKNGVSGGTVKIMTICECVTLIFTGLMIKTTIPEARRHIYLQIFFDDSGFSTPSTFSVVQFLLDCPEI